MANRFAVAAGNFNATSTWATTAAGAAGASVPVAGDVAIANNRTVTITADATCTELRNDNFSSATAGGGFILNDSVTLTANVIGGSVSASRCLTYQGTTSASVVGNCTGGSGSFGDPNQTIGVYHNGTGTLTVTGTNHAGGSGQSCAAFRTNSTGTLNITGTISPSAGTTNARTVMAGGGVINITGDVIGSPSIISGANQTIGGAANATGFSSTVTIIGNITAGLGGIAVMVGSGNLTVTGSVSAVNSYAGIESLAVIRASGSFICAADGTLPIYARKLILNTTPTASKTRYALNGLGTFVDMFTADNTGLAPAVGDVRAGVIYGSATGVLAVPPANSVAFGVAVDNTTGTAVLTAAAIRTELSVELGRLDAAISSRLAPSGTLARVTLTDTATTLTNAPTVPSVVQIRAEMDSNSTQLAAIKAKTDLLETTRLAQCSTVATTGDQIAAAFNSP